MRSDKHLRLVSSVFHNRLNHPAEYTHLDADPTRDYVNRDITGNPLLSSTGRFAALYNTCGKRTGLPAGPICSPGLRAIKAAPPPPTRRIIISSSARTTRTTAPRRSRNTSTRWHFTA